MKKLSIACGTAALAMLLAGPVRAQDSSAEVNQLRASLLTLVKTLLDQNLLTVAKAREMLRQAGIDPAALESTAAEPPPAPAAPPAPPPVRVPYVPETVKREMRDEIRKEVLATAREERWGLPEAMPSWVGRITVSGDVRLRLQRDDFADDNAPPALLDSVYQSLGSNGQATTRNTTEDRTRLRWRGRLGFAAVVNEELRANLRIVTSNGGDANDPTSTNVDAGQSSRRLGIALDQLNLGWTRGPFVVTGGRIANPYQTSDLLWSNELTLDGLAVGWLPVIDTQWSGFATLGLHPLREINNSPLNRAADAWLTGLQAGAQWRPDATTSVRAGVGLFDFKHVEARLNPAGAGDGTNTDYNDASPQVRQRGNTMFNISGESNPNAAAVWGAASKFRVLDLNAALDIVTPQQWRYGVQADLLNNIGWDADEIRARIGSAAAGLPADRSCDAGEARLQCRRTHGWRLEFSTGQWALDMPGAWRIQVGMRKLERDAVPDGYTPGDYRLGGTDVKANFLGGSYTWSRNAQLALRYVDARSIDAPVTWRVGTWTVDVTARF